MTQYMVPTGTPTVVGWTGSAANVADTPGTPNDATYIESPLSPTNAEYWEAPLSAVTSPGTTDGLVLRFRPSLNAAGGDARTVTVRIYRVADNVTVVQQTVPVTHPVSEIAVGLTSAQAALVTSYAAGALWVRVWAETSAAYPQFDDFEGASIRPQWAGYATTTLSLSTDVVPPSGGKSLKASVATRGVIVGYYNLGIDFHPVQGVGGAGYIVNYGVDAAPTFAPMLTFWANLPATWRQSPGNYAYLGYPMQPTGALLSIGHYTASETGRYSDEYGGGHWYTDLGQYSTNGRWMKIQIGVPSNTRGIGTYPGVYVTLNTPGATFTLDEMVDGLSSGVVLKYYNNLTFVGSGVGSGFQATPTFLSAGLVGATLPTVGETLRGRTSGATAVIASVAQVQNGTHGQPPSGNWCNFRPEWLLQGGGVTNWYDLAQAGGTNWWERETRIYIEDGLQTSNPGPYVPPITYYFDNFRWEPLGANDPGIINAAQAFYDPAVQKLYVGCAFSRSAAFGLWPGTAQPGLEVTIKICTQDMHAVGWSAGTTVKTLNLNNDGGIRYFDTYTDVAQPAAPVYVGIKPSASVQFPVFGAGGFFQVGPIPVS